MLSITFSGTIQILDASGTIYTKTLTGVTLSCTTFGEVQSLSVTSSPASITLPIGTINFAYIKNNGATNPVTVTWTPNGGSSNEVCVLEAGSEIVLAEATSGGGITALSVASASGTTIEYVLGG